MRPNCQLILLEQRANITKVDVHTMTEEAVVELTCKMSFFPHINQNLTYLGQVFCV